ncbi:MAG: bifunctional 2-C-methyl-D-erythritol 4-phosphate cytidylyltransferase/2-C-methyl-D-erythritol 2,4-cyclodiphosphate synthase [Rhodospirillaceae bacterium]|nr:bifunctional 2-C-methyl-D-erythritol 4-phosphate cytidylyltransferase/2-C-methyl-D-erythritol 2,4-cyclodiphosphate synthase [Rhodospirillaceae bacterium]
MAGCYALIVAAGRGQRFGGDAPKQYAPLGGGTILGESINAFINHPKIEAVRCVINENDVDLYDATAKLFSENKLLEPVFGGETRQQSVIAGLESIASLSPETVLIHDGARPFVSDELISDVISALKDAPGAIPALAVVDTIKECHDGLVKKTVSRNNLYRAQTPQGFRFSEITKSHMDFLNKNVTDDASIFEGTQNKVSIVAGTEDNFKITTQDDYIRAQNIYASGGARGETRIGFGYDVHRFTAGSGLRLCGIDIPFDKAFIGHSDADVALHALTDAMLGAIGEGDIGSHFPPSDPRWKDANSEIFVLHALDLLKKKNAKIINVDITIICEAPKIGPHREHMRAHIGGILKIDIARVSVKGTTTEKLGAMGRGEGVAAQAVASVFMG